MATTTTTTQPQHAAADLALQRKEMGELAAASSGDGRGAAQPGSMELRLRAAVKVALAREPVHCMAVLTRSKNCNVVMFIERCEAARGGSGRPFVAAEWLELERDPSGNTRSAPTFLENAMAFGFVSADLQPVPHFRLKAAPGITWYVHALPAPARSLLLVELGAHKLAATRIHVVGLDQMRVHGWVMPARRTALVVTVNRAGRVLGVEADAAAADEGGGVGAQ
jgi:hypothetical protein